MYDTVRNTVSNGHLNLDSHFAPSSSQQPEDRAHTPIQEPEHEASQSTEVQQQPTVSVIEPVREPTPSPKPAPAAQLEPVPEPTYEPLHEPDHEPAPVVQEPVQESVPVPTLAPVLPPQPEPIIITRENPVNEELYAKFNMAQAEIERLKGQIAALSTPAAQELRRRTRKLSDPDSVAASDVQTIVEGGEPLQQEGVPLQVVVIIALGVFVMTYLFF